MASAGLHALVLGLFALLVPQAAIGESLDNLAQAFKCVVPDGVEDAARTALLQKCISDEYGQGDENPCYEGLGCFPMAEPWTSNLRPLPSPYHPLVINTTLYCYTRESPQRFNVTLHPLNMGGCNFKPERWSMFLMHGFANNGNTHWLQKFKDYYLKRVDANVFIVDWGQGAEYLNYLRVASNTRIVGAELARYIKYLRTNFGLTPDKVHLIGHSLGAHIASYTAKRVPGIARLTAMDPAQPGFEGTDSTVRLDKSDAVYVEVLHTNAAPFIPLLGYGMIAPRGHVDIYVNGGQRQPDCLLPNMTNIKLGSMKDLADYSVEQISEWVCCSHCRAYEMYMEMMDKDCYIWARKASFAESVVNYGSRGVVEPLFSLFSKCKEDTCIPLSLNTVTFKARGVFAATTPSRPPYCERDSVKNNKYLKEIGFDPQIKPTDNASLTGGCPWLTPNHEYDSRAIVRLHQEIEDFYRYIAPTEEERLSRLGVVRRINRTVVKMWPEAELKVFGSFPSGLYLPTSDIDTRVTADRDFSEMFNLGRALVESNICKPDQIEVLAGITVPIIKLKDQITNIDVDISIRGTINVNMTETVRKYQNQFPALRRLVLTLKQFLLQEDLNKKFTGGINSSTLTLMIITFLQLKTKSSAGKSTEENLGNLLIGFFELYGPQYNHRTITIRVEDNTIYLIKDEFIGNGDSDLRHCMLCVEDPDNPDTYSPVSYKNKRLKQAFEHAHTTLQEALVPEKQIRNDKLPSILGEIFRVTDHVVNARLWGKEDYLRVGNMTNHGSAIDCIVMRKAISRDT